MEVTRLNSVVDNLRTPNKEDCKVCNQKFNSRKELNLHRKSEHPKQIKCKFCEETFDETYKLEQHLKKHESKGFKCEHCEKMFHLEWRFKSTGYLTVLKLLSSKIGQSLQCETLFLQTLLDHPYLIMLIMKILTMEMSLKLILTQTWSMSVILAEKFLKRKVNFGTTKAVLKCVDMDVRSVEHHLKEHLEKHCTKGYNELYP